VTATTRLGSVAALGILALLAPVRLNGQFVPAVLRSTEIASARADCGTDAVASRLLGGAHPLGAAAVGAPRCLADEAVRWVPTRSLTSEEESRLERALVKLAGASDGTCRAAGRALDERHRRGRVSVWRAVDTADGMVYFGATYLAPDATPIAVQFWAPAFSRSLDWFVGAAAHEGFHVLQPRADEAEAVAFGDRCREATRGVMTIAGAG